MLLQSQQDLEKRVYAFIFSRLDSCNSVFTGLSESIRQLQLIQNAAARILTRTKEVDHITPVLRRLHWLHVSQRIDFKILLLVYEAMKGFRPKYISDLQPRHEPSRPLRSSGSGLLSVPRVRTKPGEAAFSYYAPHIGTNSLKTAGLLRLSPLLNKDWRPFCLPLLLTEAILELWTAQWLLFSIISIS